MFHYFGPVDLDFVVLIPFYKERTTKSAGSISIGKHAALSMQNDNKVVPLSRIGRRLSIPHALSPVRHDERAGEKERARTLFPLSSMLLFPSPGFFPISPLPCSSFFDYRSASFKIVAIYAVMWKLRAYLRAIIQFSSRFEKFGNF